MIFNFLGSILCLIGVHDFETVATKEVEEFKHGEYIRDILWTQICLRPGCQVIWDEIGGKERREKERAQWCAQRKEDALRKYKMLK
jgi:hypothetical protein